MDGGEVREKLIKKNENTHLQAVFGVYFCILIVYMLVILYILLSFLFSQSSIRISFQQ